MTRRPSIKSFTVLLLSAVKGVVAAKMRLSLRAVPRQGHASNHHHHYISCSIVNRKPLPCTPLAAWRFGVISEPLWNPDVH
jgi:hypothetical protein